MNFSEALRKTLLEQGYKWVRNSKDLGEIEKLALQWYDTQILHNRYTGTYSLYAFGSKLHKPMFGSFEVRDIRIRDNEVIITPLDAPPMHFKDITAFEDEKVERFDEAEEAIAEELIEKKIPPEEWENYGISAEVITRLERKKKVKEPTLIEYGVEPMFIPIKKGVRVKTLFAFGEKSIDVRSVPTEELKNALTTGLYQGFELRPEDIEIIKEEIRRREEEERVVEREFVERMGKETACPECSIRVETKERWWAHLKIHHPELYEQLKAEERAERRRRAKERAKKIPEDAKFIARTLNVDVFTANSILNRILSQNLDWQVVDWEAIAERDWRNRYDRDEYLRQIEERIMRYGINLHPIEEETKRELESLQEEFEIDQLENMLEEIYIEGMDEERTEFLKSNAEALINMAQRGDQRAKVALADFFPEIPMEKYLRPEEMKGRRGLPKISAKDIKIDREIAKQLDDVTLENVLKRRKLFGRVLLKKEAEIFAEELEMRRLAKMPPGVPPMEEMTRERQIAEVKALISPLLTSQLEEMVVTGMAFGMPLEDWALEVIKEELRQREEAIMPTIHGEDYPVVVRLIAEAKTLRELDEIISDIARRSYLLSEADILELQTKAIEKRGRREEELKEMEERVKIEEEKPPEKKPPPEAPPPAVTPYPEPKIEMATCPECGVVAPNLDFDTRGFVAILLGLPVELFDVCSRCLTGVYYYTDVLTLLSNAIDFPRKFNLSSKDVSWLRKVRRTIKESKEVVVFALDLDTAFTLGAWLYKYFKERVLEFGVRGVFATNREAIAQAFGDKAADDPSSPKIVVSQFVGKWLSRQALKPSDTPMKRAVSFLFSPKQLMSDWFEDGFDVILERHNITVCAALNREGIPVIPTGEVVFERPKCTVSDDTKKELIDSLIQIIPEFKIEEVEGIG